MNDTPTTDDNRLARLEQTVASLISRVYQLERGGAMPRLATTLGAAPIAPLAPPAPTPHAEPVPSLETTLGTFWLSRIGIVSLITGAALLIITYFGELGPVVRVALGYLMAGALAWTGWRLARTHRTFGQIVFGGGLAIAYFVTYSLHFIPSMRVIDSEPLGVALVAVAIAGVVATAHRLKSETVAGIALFLGLHTGMLSDVTTLSLVVSTMLAVGAVFFLVANQWVIVPFSTVVAVYSTHANLAFGSGTAVSPALGLAFLAMAFTLFSFAAVLRPDIKTRSLVVLAALNWIGMIGLGAHALHAVSRDAVFGFLCAFAAVHVVLAALGWIRKASREYTMFLLGLAIITAAIALPTRLEDWTLLSGWLGLALASAYIARRTGMTAFGGLALTIALAAQADAYFAIDGVAAQVACLLAFFAAERLEARGARTSAMQHLYVIAVALGLLRLAQLAIPADVETISWVGASFVLFAVGFALRSSVYRWAGFGVLALAALRFLGVQVRMQSTGERILTFVIAGIALLVVSFIYTRRKRESPSSRSARPLE